MIKKILASLLLFPAACLAQNQGNDAPLGGGGLFIFGYVNEAQTALASGDAKTNLVGLRRDGSVLTFPSTSAANFVSASVAFGSVGTSYAVLLTNTNKAKYIDCMNGTDVEIRVSSDGTNDTLGAIPAGSGKFIPLASEGLHVATNIRIKGLSAPTSGNVTCSLAY